MGATKAGRGLFGLGMLLLGSLVVVDAVWAQGEVSFIARREFRVGAFPHSVAVGDFNGDGRRDLATANLDTDTVSILLGQGDGTFQAAIGLLRHVLVLDLGEVERERFARYR